MKWIERGILNVGQCTTTLTGEATLNRIAHHPTLLSERTRLGKGESGQDAHRSLTTSSMTTSLVAGPSTPLGAPTFRPDVTRPVHSTATVLAFARYG